MYCRTVIKITLQHLAPLSKTSEASWTWWIWQHRKYLFLSKSPRLVKTWFSGIGGWWITIALTTFQSRIFTTTEFEVLKKGQPNGKRTYYQKRNCWTYASHGLVNIIHSSPKKAQEPIIQTLHRLAFSTKIVVKHLGRFCLILRTWNLLHVIHNFFSQDWFWIYFWKGLGRILSANISEFFLTRLSLLL